MNVEQLRHSHKRRRARKGMCLRMELHTVASGLVSAHRDCAGYVQQIPCTALGSLLRRKTKAQPPAVHPVESMFLRTIPLRVCTWLFIF